MSEDAAISPGMVGVITPSPGKPPKLRKDGTPDRRTVGPRPWLFQKGRKKTGGNFKVKPVEENIHDPRWYTSDLSWKLYPHGQLAAYRWVKQWMADHPGNAGPLLINCHRRFGKTFLAYLIGSEAALANRRRRVRIYTPSQNQGFDISDDVWPDLIADKPRDILWQPSDGNIRVLPWRNKKKKPTPEEWITQSSMIIHHGTECRYANSARGLGANIIIMDEAQNMMDLERVMTRVVGWQTLKKKGILVLILFTPPHCPHPLNQKYIPEAIEDGRYFELKILDDEDFTEEEIRGVENLVGSRHSLGFQVEGQCQWQLYDIGNTVFPEWNQYANVCRGERRPFELVYQDEREYPLPEYYYPIVSIDWGCLHFTSVLYSYWDFERKFWIIRDEIWIREKTTPQIIALIKGGIEKNFGKAQHSVAMIGDLQNAQQQEDLRSIWNFRVQPARKHDKDMAVASVNALINQGLIRVKSSCRALLNQLSFGCYRKDTNRFSSNLTRRDDNLTGDLDALDCLLYGYQKMRQYQKIDPKPESGKFYGEKWVPDSIDAEDVEGPRFAPVLEEHVYDL